MKSKRFTSGSADSQQRRKVLWPHQTSHNYAYEGQSGDSWPGCTSMWSQLLVLFRGRHSHYQKISILLKRYICLLQNNIFIATFWWSLSVCTFTIFASHHSLLSLTANFCCSHSLLNGHHLYFHSACVYACVKPSLHTEEKNTLYVCLSCYGWLHSIWQVLIIPWM